MLIPIFNILIGAGLAVGGASGKLTLLGTNSSTALIIGGSVIAGIGIIQLLRGRRR